MENSLFWDAKSVNGEFDRVYSSDDFADFFKGFWGDGVIPSVKSSLYVEAIENSFSVVVNPGCAIIGGRLYQNTEDYKFTLDTSGDAVRIDYIVVRLDKSKRAIYLRVLKGADNGLPPTIAQLDSCFDLVLAKIRIPANAQYLADEDLTDMRGTSLCPWVNLHWEISNLQGQFQQWYDNLQAKFTDSVVGDLSSQIDNLDNDVQAAKAKTEEFEVSLDDMRQYSRSIIKKNGSIYLKYFDYDASKDEGL